jgi:prepilin-type N-terminal cleavage/methylation domain-containing protein
MKRGFTIVELLVCIAALLIGIGLVCAGIKKFTAAPEVVKVQQTGSVEVQSSRTVTKVPYGQIEEFLSNIPADVKIGSVVPVFSGSGKTFDIDHYLVITEK